MADAGGLRLETVTQTSRARLRGSRSARRGADVADRRPVQGRCRAEASGVPPGQARVRDERGRWRLSADGRSLTLRLRPDGGGATSGDVRAVELSPVGCRHRVGGIPVSAGAEGIDGDQLLDVVVRTGSERRRHAKSGLVLIDGCGRGHAVVDLRRVGNCQRRRQCGVLGGDGRRSCDEPDNGDERDDQHAVYEGLALVIASTEQLLDGSEHWVSPFVSKKVDGKTRVCSVPLWTLSKPVAFSCLPPLHSTSHVLALFTR